MEVMINKRGLFKAKLISIISDAQKLGLEGGRSDNNLCRLKNGSFNAVGSPTEVTPTL